MEDCLHEQIQALDARMILQDEIDPGNKQQIHQWKIKVGVLHVLVNYTGGDCEVMCQSIPKLSTIPFNEAGLILGQISHCMEWNSSDMPGVWPGKRECGLGSFGVDWYIKKNWLGSK